MNETTRHAAGTFCWPELSTTDQAGAKKFYTALFGWDFLDHSMGPDGVYTMFKLDGKELGAAAGMDAQRKSQGIPSHWLSYVSVDDAEAATSKAKSLGGTALMGPFDVMDAGKMSVLLDPTGAAFAIWQAGKHIGARVIDQTGTLVWTELMTNDEKAAGAFYTGLFGWKTEAMQSGSMPYTVFKRGDTPAGGMARIMPAWGKIPPNWLVYFGVNDTDATTAKAVELGGKTLAGPEDIPNVGRFSVIQDPQGATFGIIKFVPR